VNKKAIFIGFVALIFGAVGGYWVASNADLKSWLDRHIFKHIMTVSQETGVTSERQALFYRNPMNPAITSPVPAQDEMGMDYIPVYADAEKSKTPEVLFYRNPMNPAITSSVPAQDEMGMDYLPVYAEEDDQRGNEPAGTVTIDPVTVQNMGIRAATVIRRAIARRLDSLGRVDFNEERLARLHPKTTGWIEKLMVNETGASVNKDSMLLSIYSPDLVAAQREYLNALSHWDVVKNKAPSSLQKTTRTMLESSRERLELLDVPSHQLKDLEETRHIRKYLHIHSPFVGTIMNIGAREGQYVTPKDQLYLIADLSRVWVYVDVYEDELPWVKVGDQVEMRVRAAPGHVFRGKVGFIYPYLEGRTRTVRVRLSFDNPGMVLKPGMFANVVLYADPQPDAMVVPSEAIVRSGSREQVFVLRGGGKFEPREVSVGLSAEGFTQILQGVEVGEQVVTSAVFLIDSESKLREATAKMMEAMQASESSVKSADMLMDDMSLPTEAAADPSMSMDDMDMSDMSDMQMSE